jgi:phosphotriesterase-related protein
MALKLQTVRGPVAGKMLGLVLPHEHLFTDLRGPQAGGYAQGDPTQVVQVVGPYLAEAASLGVTALVECSTVGVGRNLQVLQHLAESTPIHILAPTGVYRDAYIPDALRGLSERVLSALWVKELTEGMEDTSIRAGFIKLAMSDDGPTDLEIRNLRAAAMASQATGCAIAIHTIGGRTARQEMDILAGAGLDLQRFIWVHAQTEPDISILMEAARRGAFVELDSVGAPFQNQEELLETVTAMIQRGYTNHLLLSHDAGWYNPGSPDGLPEGGFRGYSALVREFIPALLQRGVTEQQVRRITVDNPVRAYAF